MHEDVVVGDAYRRIARHAARGAGARRTPLLLGVTGGVASGKSVTARLLRELIDDEGVSASELSTDSFLLPNGVLGERGLAARKGFPETFDSERLDACLASLSAGEPVDVPVYSHEVYDVVEDRTRAVEPAQVVVVEGLNVLQSPFYERVDVSVYLDADETVLRSWFVDRFLRLCDDAGPGATSFYRGFASMSERERRATAETVWDSINGVNLREHVVPTRGRATFVVRKDRTHRVVDLAGPGASLLAGLGG